MYGNILRSADQYFGRNITLPAAAAVTAPDVLVVGEHLGSLALAVAVKNPVTLAQGGKININMADSDSPNGPFIPLTVAFEFTFAAGIGNTVNTQEGDMILQIALPDCAKYLQVSIGSNDPAASGSVDIFMTYLSR